ncbi:MAG TPA: sigma-70 family RNA polymerase sigma factor [Edaphobacter sp.]|jgi:RNA polymerase sigma-70 factor (ECF subfamily)|nr:sigma-70 family RNA polymerase sigma factor [Edaphobacter sp.]
MLTQVETHAVFLPSSLVREDADFALQLRRDELTDLIVTERNHFQRIAFSILRDGAEAEDVVHTSFCAAWMAMGRFRGDSSMKTWFSRIVSNHALLALRKMRRKTVVFLEDSPEYLHSFEQSFSFAGEDPEEIAQRQEALWLVRRHMKDLPVETRIMVALFFSRDYSIQQIAELRGKSGPSVKAHLHRGKTMLRKSICRMRTRTAISPR